MYLPPHFEETDASEIYGLVSAFPLATLVANSPSGLLANHIPLIATGDDVFAGHIALNNDLHRILGNGDEVLAIFKGADAYISPNWYPSKQEHHKHVPTWNYEVVHVQGKISFQHDVKTKMAIVGRMTQHFEARTQGDRAWRMADAPKDYMEAMINNIVAIRIDVTVITGKSKLSQNRTPDDHDSVARNLLKTGSGRLAARMARTRSD
jgi:transcriptional regulator